MKACFLLIIIMLVCLPMFSVIHKLGDYYTPEYPRSVVVCGDTVYIADYTAGLQILDVSIPQSPALLGSYNTPGEANAVVVKNQIAYIADGEPGLIILDVANPQAPILLSTYDTPGNADDVFIGHNKAYIADYSGGITILDISNPAFPLLLNSDSSIGYVSSIWIDFNQNIAYAAGGEFLKIVNIIDPTNMQLLSTLAFDEEIINTVVVRDSIAYVAGQNGGLYLYDVSDPINPTFINNLNMNAEDIVLKNNIAYMATLASFSMIDISNPYNLEIIGSYDVENFASSVAVQGDVAYVVDLFSGLQILDISDLTNSQILGEYNPAHRSFSVNTVGNIAYLSTWGGGYKILDISDSQNPQLLGSFGNGDIYFDCFWMSCVQGNRAYLATSMGLQILDITNPETPQLLSTYRQTTPYGLYVDGNTLYSASAELGLQIFDVSDVQNPTVTGVCNTPGYAWSVIVSGNIAYVADGYSGLQVIDVSNPLTPVYLGSLDTDGYCQTVQLTGNTVYLTDTEEGVVIIDVTIPTVPARLGTIKPYPTSTIRKTFLKDNLLYTSDEGWNEIRIYDVSNSSMPNLIYTYAWNCRAYGLWEDNGKLYVASDFRGLKIFDLNGIVPVTDEEVIPSSQLDLTNYPNPFNPNTTICFSLQKSDYVKLDIYNTKGQIVTSLMNGQVSSGEHRIQWNGMDKNNQPVASCMYFARIDSKGKAAIAKLLLLK